MWLITKFTESAQDHSTTINRARKKSQFTDQIVAGHVHSPPQSSFPKGKGTGPKPHPICLSHFTGVIGFTRSRPSPRRIQTPLSCSQVGTSGKSIEVWLLLLFFPAVFDYQRVLYCIYTVHMCIYIVLYIILCMCYVRNYYIKFCDSMLVQFIFCNSMYCNVMLCSVCNVLQSRCILQMYTDICYLIFCALCCPPGIKGTAVLEA